MMHISPLRAQYIHHNHIYVSVRSLVYVFPLINEGNDFWSFDQSQPYMRFIFGGNDKDETCWVLDQQYGWSDSTVLEELVETATILPGLP